MPTVLQDPTFSEFLEASSAARTTDFLDNIEMWVAESLACIDGVKKSVARLRRRGVELIGADVVSQYQFSDCIRTEEMTTSIWEEAAAYFWVRYVKPLGIAIDDPSSFVRAALRVRERGPWRDARTGEPLTRWDASAVRTYFEQKFGDPREATIKQLRARVFTQTFHTRRPEAEMIFYPSMHEFRHGGQVVEMGMYHSSQQYADFVDLLRFAIHLETGAAPNEILIPAFVGYGPYSAKWARTELLKKQRNPVPGVEWLRFMAENRVKVAFTPTVASRMQTLFDLHAAAKLRRI